MSGKSLRFNYMRAFRNLTGYSTAVCWLIVGGYLFQILALNAAGAYLLSLPTTTASAVAMGVVILLIGTRFRGLNNIVHECSHFAFAVRRQANHMFGRLCCAVILKSFVNYRVEHLSHHAHLGDYEHDLDFKVIRHFRLEDPLTPRTVLRHLVTPLLGLHLPYYVSVDTSARDGLGWTALKAGVVLASLAYLALAPLTALLFLVLPFFVVYSAINYWTDCLDHGGLVGSEDELDASRNIVVPRALRLVLFPRNDCYHLIHHLFPQVPVRHFDACHAELLQDPAYRARARQGALAEALAPGAGSSPPTAATPALQQ